jgi:hypothetical protein
MTGRWPRHAGGGVVTEWRACGVPVAAAATHRGLRGACAHNAHGRRSGHFASGAGNGCHVCTLVALRQNAAQRGVSGDLARAGRPRLGHGQAAGPALRLWSAAASGQQRDYAGAWSPLTAGGIGQAYKPRPDTPDCGPAHLRRCLHQLHHSKHHNAYVTNYNTALQQYAEAEQKGDIARMIALQSAIKFNGGGASLRLW